MRKSKQFLSMPVISLEEGQQIGTVKGLVVDPSRKRVAALAVDQKGWFKEYRYIPFERLHSVGEDAITVERSTAVHRGTALPEIPKLVKEKVEIIGARIVAENGTILGQVDEYYVDLTTGDLIGLEFSGNFLSGLVRGKAFLDINYVLTLGRELIVCSNEALNGAVKMDGGLQETVGNLRESTTHLLEVTREKTRSLGTLLNRFRHRGSSPTLRAEKDMPPPSEPPAGPPQD